MIGIYTRRSNRHNWILSGLADDKLGLIRHVYLASKDYPDEQIGIYTYDDYSGLVGDYDNKPSNYPMSIIRPIDLATAESLVNLVNNGVMSLFPCSNLSHAIELGLLE